MLILLSLLACGKDVEPTPGPFDDVQRTDSFMLDGLSCPAEVIRTEGDVPRIYAHDDVDLARVQGFVVARHRYFMMDLARRLAAGRTSELLGADALETDLESRQMAMTFVAEQLIDALTEEQRAQFTAFAAGVNDYIAAVEAEELDAPSEMVVAAPLLGFEEPHEIMEPFTMEDIAYIGATLIYELGFETGDVGRASTEAALNDSLFEGAAFEALRRDGARVDLWEHVNPVYPVSSAPGWGGAAKSARSAAAGPPAAAQGERVGAGPVPRVMFDRLVPRLERFQEHLGHDWEGGFGSNSWAVSGDVSADGALLAGDGHLSLTVPSLFYQIGLDTSVLGGGDTHQAGLVVPGMPTLAVGTNGDVAWCQTQLFGDITDWYREEIQLGSDGLPSASSFQGAWQDLERFDEEYIVADVPVLGSEGRTEVWPRWTTFDGRWLVEIEGEQVDTEGPGVVNLQGDLVIPGDIDGDGVITALSFDYVGLDPGNILAALDAFGHSETVEEFQEATKRLVAYSQNMVVADSTGSIFYTGYQAVPCRGYLERDPSGDWAEGSNPSQLLDGTRYGGFTIPLADGIVQEGDSDPYRCVVPFDEYPQVIDPAQGYVLTANNDPGNISTDDSLLDDPWYIGGPWLEGYRANVIEQELEAMTAAGGVTVEDMTTLQADTRSVLALQFGGDLLDALDSARAASEDGATPDSADARMAAIYEVDPDAFDEVGERLESWLIAGAPAASGVESFYHQPADGDRDHAAATSIFNAWFNRFLSGVLDDEGLPDVWEPTGATGRMRGLTRLMEGRGGDNPEALASWNEETGESAFFDVLGTDPVETSEEVAMMALHDAVEFLRSEPVDDVKGGYGTDDMDQWLWGLRHVVKFESLLGDFIGGGDFDFLVDQFSITTLKLPLEVGMDGDDPRADLQWFPRAGDNLVVDAANPGFDFDDPSYGSGPVFRMVIGLDGGVITGRNILPGGQSAITESEFFDDQASLWLANDTLPLRFHLEDVLEGAVSRETYVPKDLGAACAGR